MVRTHSIKQTSDAGKEADDAADVARCYGFTLSGAKLLFDDSLPVEFILKPVYYTLPNSVPYCMGLINVRGNVVPLYSVHFLLGVDRVPTRIEYGLLVGEGSDAVVLAVESEPVYFNVENLEASSENQLSDLDIGEFVIQSYTNDDEVWSLLDAGALFESLAGRPGK